MIVDRRDAMAHVGRRRENDVTRTNDGPRDECERRVVAALTDPVSVAPEGLTIVEICAAAMVRPMLVVQILGVLQRRRRVVVSVVRDEDGHTRTRYRRDV